MENIYKPKKKFSLPIPKFSFRKKGTVEDAKSIENKRKFRFPWKFFMWFFIIIFVIFIILAIAGWFVIGKPAYAIYTAGMDLKGSSYQLKEALKTQDLGKIEENLTSFNTDYEQFKVVYAENSPNLKNLPVVKNYVGDVDYVLKATDSSIELGFVVIKTLDPYAAELGLKAGSTKFNNEQRIQQIAQVLPKFVQEVDQISALLVDIDNDLSNIDATKYPEDFRGVAIRDQIVSLQTVASQLAQKSPKFKGLFEQLPTLIGVGAPQKYLVLMANSTELRMGGGFTTYAIVVELNNGIPKIVKAVDTYMIDVDSFALENRNVPPFMRNYLRVNRLYARDALSVYPDFKDGADLFVNRYWNLHPGSAVIGTLPAVDGVIQVNTHLAEELLRVLGPVDVTGRAFLTDAGTYKGFSDTEFNADNVIYNLESIANSQLSEIAGRKDIIQFLMESMLNKTLNAKTENLAALAGTFLESLGSKDLIVYSFNEEAQVALEDLGYAGRVVAPKTNTQDYLFVVHSNFGAGKRDWIVSRDTIKETYVKDGKNYSKVTITTTNPKAPDWWHSSWLYTYKDYMRLYVPKGSKLVSAVASDGSELNAQQTSYEYLDTDYPGLEYIEANFWVDEGKVTTVTVEYELPDTIDMDNYSLLVQKQSGTHGDIYTFKKGEKEEKITLNEDTVITFD
jgi:hypothetical protein